MACVELCVCLCVCVIPTWSIEEIFDLEAEQRGRDARFIVHLSCYCLQPKHIIVQRLWQSLSWVWTKDKQIKKEKKEEKRSKGKGGEQDRQRNATNIYNIKIFYIYLTVSLALWV